MLHTADADHGEDDREDTVSTILAAQRSTDIARQDITVHALTME